MKIRCLIVDDEPIAQQILETYCAYLPELEVVGSCGNALEARQALLHQRVDLLFLDINMPILDGLAFLRTLAKPPLIVFTTAYKEFAHEAFDLAATDYLLKPFSLERFMVALEKVRERLKVESPVADTPVGATHTFIKSEGKIYRVDFGKVLYAEADGNNVKLVTETGLIRPAITFAALEQLLPRSQFIRSHRSFMVNREKISQIEGNQLFIGSVKIPIGASYRELFLRELGLKY